MNPRWLTWRATIACALVLAAGASVGAYELHNHQSTSRADRSAVELAAAFLNSWTDQDGRVVRRDQGGDTVSEGQAYGMLLAVVAHDQDRFDTIWNWTKLHMQQADGLLSWRWSNGQLTDGQPAADADVDTAWALSRAASAFGNRGYADEGSRIARAILANETVASTEGPLLVAGPWAKAARATVNPSYLVGGMATLLARVSGDPTWNSTAEATRELDRTVVANGTLPPDWATVAVGSRPASITPAGAPDGSAGPRYGLDAPRLLIRLAASCSPDDRAIAASATPLAVQTSAPAIRTLSGQDEADWQHPISAVAAAAVESTVGNSAGVATSLTTAADNETKFPSYYGAAWVALGRALLTTELLGTCARTAT